MGNLRYKGGALLTALFIMTLVAIVATAMSTKLQVDIYRTKLIITRDKLYLASQGLTFWALAELNDSKQKFPKANRQGLLAQYPAKMETIYPLVKVSGGLYDAQAQYNLNNLANKKEVINFINLLDNNASKINKSEKLNIALAIHHWLSSFDLAHGKDNFASYYLKQRPPYQSSHQLMASSSEFRLIQGVTPELDLTLQPLITALPEITPLNINTASKKALLTLSNAMNEENAEKLIGMRKKNGIKKNEKFNEFLKKLNIANEQITLESTYFLSIANATSDNTHLTVYTLFKRSRNAKGKLTVTVVRESFNIF